MALIAADLPALAGQASQEGISQLEFPDEAFILEQEVDLAGGNAEGCSIFLRIMAFGQTVRFGIAAGLVMALLTISGTQLFCGYNQGGDSIHGGNGTFGIQDPAHFAIGSCPSKNHHLIDESHPYAQNTGSQLDRRYPFFESDHVASPTSSWQAKSPQTNGFTIC